MTPSLSPSKISLAALGGLIAILSPLQQSRATAYAWQGTGTVTAPNGGNWNLAADWSGGVIPVSAATTELDFDSGTASYVSTNNIPSPPFNLNILTVATGAGTGTISVAGSGLEFVTNGSGPVINQNGGGIVAFTAPIDLNGNLTLQGMGAGQVSFTGLLTDSGSLTISRTGTNGGEVINNASNTYSGGTFLTGGSLVSQAPGSLGSGVVSLNTVKLTFSVANGTYGNDIAVTGGLATIESDVTTTISGTSDTIATGATLGLQDSTSGGMGTISGVISGLGNVAKSNSVNGGWILSGNNTYTGTTTISDGPLAITGVTSGQGSYSVSSTATLTGTLAGNGTIGLAAGKTLSVGGVSGGQAFVAPSVPNSTAVGTLSTVWATTNAANKVAFNNYSTLSIVVAGSGSSDRLVVGSSSVAGALTLASTSTVLSVTSLPQTTAFDGSTYVVANYFGTLTGTFSTLVVDGTTEASATSFTDNGFQYNLVYGVPDSNGGYDIELTTVPEPATWVAPALMLAIVSLRKRGRAVIGDLFLRARCA